MLSLSDAASADYALCMPLLVSISLSSLTLWVPQPLFHKLRYRLKEPAHEWTVLEKWKMNAT